MKKSSRVKLLICLTIALGIGASRAKAMRICVTGASSLCYAACSEQNEACENHCPPQTFSDSCTTTCWSRTEACYDKCDIEHCYGEV